MAGPYADAVIVAAGGSTRMGGTDKMAELLLGRSLLQWSVETMAAAQSVARVIVVARPDRVADLAAQPWLSQATVVAGGERRSDSVRAGVEAANADIVLVHDGARPLASSALADAVAAAAARHGAAVPVVAVVDSLKRDAGATLGQSLERDGLVRAQTPQAARRQLLLDAMAAAGGDAFSDEAGLLESRGIAVATVPGEASNIKVTLPEDLEMVRALARGGGESRIGLGQDSHGFGPDLGLWLGGIQIDGAPRLYGHSDGDVVLHAIATAILSATGNGDLGRLFPSDDRQTTGIASADLLREAVARASQSGWVVESAQVSVVGARPRLGGQRLDEMAANVAELLGVGRDSVAINASTGNLSGDEGAGRVISATALIGLHRR
ncbi:MAG: 2-C-methyl-D-erythritol 4-phosphate cytidylyltransferase [Chloroflexota bacterium]|jgi:2-C-methyl-D-erythritol 4-phosphate cytidylyltransferase/2-C-methyl-D-erythritol 2,4-cyclodiphosphate synthase|nr:2-C-methyl-D-erythritol 4-phosphate cytidylyltransferase [Chloroflexota bacterium]